MKILHLSNDDLPDWRVEKAAFTAINRGHTTYFVGPKSSNYSSPAFSKTYVVQWAQAGLLQLLPSASFGNTFSINQIRKQLRRIIDEVRPDIIHAHNIVAAKIAAGMGINYVYDDHEFWSSYARLNNESVNMSILLKLLTNRKVKDAGYLFLMRYAAGLWEKWEREIISSVPVITTSEAVAQHHRSIQGAKEVVVVHNFPAKHEIRNFSPPAPHETLSSVYAGGDWLNQIRPHRNFSGFIEIFMQNNIGKLSMIGVNGSSSSNVIFTGLLSREAMYNEMFKSSIGILPWKSHWSHSYYNPNKPFEYAHAGLLIMCTNSFTEVRKLLDGHCMVFEDYKQLKDLLEYCRDNPNEVYEKRLETFDYARKKLLWESQEDNIIAAYNYSFKC